MNACATGLPFWIRPLPIVTYYRLSLGSGKVRVGIQENITGDNMQFGHLSASLTLAVAGVLASGSAHAAVVEKGLAANAPAHCQAFTPGPTNTIRNRVVGSENVGATMNVACAFEKGYSENAGFVKSVYMYFSNSGTGTISINCSLLTGWQGQGGAFVVNKTVAVTAGEQASLEFSAADTVDPSDTDLGFDLVGVNCTLPKNAVINDTYIYWDEATDAV